MRFPFRFRPSWTLLLLYGALAAALVSGLVYFFLSSVQSPKLDTAFAPSKTDVVKDRSVPSEKLLRIVPTSEKGRLHETGFPSTGAELAAANKLLKTLEQDFKALESAKAEVIYQMENEFIHQTIVLISPPEPEQLATAWERFWQALFAVKLRGSLAGEIASKAQRMEKNYSGWQGQPFKTIHSWRSKQVKNANTVLLYRTHERRPDIRFDEYGNPLVTSDNGNSTLHTWEVSKKETWERHGHLFQLMPVLSNLDDPRVEKP